ncbi:hypothetical protein L195_g061489, partial [Trifolium pratense]
MSDQYHLANDNEDGRDCDCYDTKEDEKVAATKTRTVTASLSLHYRQI